MKKIILKSVRVGSVAKLSLVIGGLIGLFGAIVFLMISLLLVFVLGGEDKGMALWRGGLAQVILFPFLIGIGAALFNSIAAFLYNIFSTLIGGVEITTEEKN